MKSFFRLVLMTLLLALVALMSALTAMRLAIHGREVAVPKLIGLTPAEGERTAAAGQLQMEVERQYYSADIPEGRIMSQLPPPGARVRRGWRLRVAESLGPQRVVIPSVLGQTQRAAEITIRRRGLDVSSVAGIAIAAQPPDQVISQSPPPNASGIAAPKIGLLVTTAPPPPAFVMPDFAGQSLGSAAQVLQDAGLRLGTVSVAAPPANASPLAPPPQPSPASAIVSQIPAAGEKVTAGAVVNFEVR